MMNDINDIVFKVYKGVLDMDYSKNENTSIIKKIKKLYRYIVSGYIFQYKKNKTGFSKMNLFSETAKRFPEYKLVIYTVSTGKYDEIKEPIYVSDNIDYYVFTDQQLDPCSIWKKLPIPESIKNMTALEQARYLKTNPHRFFESYDYSMFIDGNVCITCDVSPLFFTVIAENKLIAIHKHQNRDCIYDEAKAIYAAGKASMKSMRLQLRHYKEKGFPKHFGLFETNIVIRKHNDDRCKEVMTTWSDEIMKWTKRDQLSFTYALWKNNLTSKDVLSLGNNSRKNPYFIVDSHR